MSSSLWILGAVGVVIVALRWTLADLVLDQVGWLTDWLRRGGQREGPTGGEA